MGWERRNYYLIYYIISFILIFFSIITFFISQKIRQYLTISLSSIFFSFYFFEGYLTYHNNFLPHEKIYKKITGKKWDKRTKFEIYNDLKKIDSEITVNRGIPDFFWEPNSNYKILPLGGISNIKTIHCNENGYFSIYNSDRYGFNNPDEEWDSQEIEFLLVGDSFTHGACVNRPNDIGSVLRTLSNKSVLNLGFGGNGPLLEYATLREYLRPNVKNVLWLFYENDAGPIPAASLSPNSKRLRNYLDDLFYTQNLKLKQKEIDELLHNLISDQYDKTLEKTKFNFFISFVSFLKLPNTRERLNNYLPKRFKPKYKGYFQPPLPVEFKEILELSKALSEQNNSKFYFIYLPNFHRYDKENRWMIEKFDDSNYKSLIKITSELNIPFIDIHAEVFEKEKDPLSLYPFGWAHYHYNIEGYKKTANTIYDFIINK